MIEALKSARGRDDRLNPALGISLVLHLAVVWMFSSLAPGSLSGGRLAGKTGGDPMRAVLRGAPSPEQMQEQRRSAVADRQTAEQGNPAPSQPQSSVLPRSSRPQGQPGPDSYTTVETRKIFHAPIASYLPLGQLDIRPWIAVHVEPEYPAAAAHRFMSGKVLIRVLINEEGKVDRTIVVSAEPQGFFEVPAQNAFNAARYTPGVKMGKAVKSQLLIEVTFTSAGPPKIVEIKSP